MKVERALKDKKFIPITITLESSLEKNSLEIILRDFNVPNCYEATLSNNLLYKLKTM